MNNTIKGIALLKVLFESDKDYIDLFIPFIASLISKNEYKIIEIEVICNDFENEYGLLIPYHPMQTILKRAKRRDLIKLDNGTYIPNSTMISEYDFSTKSFEKSKEIDDLINRFIKFSKEKFNKGLSFEEAEQTFISYLKENEKEILNAYQDISLLPDIHSSKENKYLINSFIKHVYEFNYLDYKLITQVISGYTLANCIFFDEPNNFKGKIKGLKIYLDTRIILRLVGLEGKYREDSYIEFMKFLFERGAVISIFDHTLDEVNGIIEDCINWVNNPSYKPSLASPVLRHFVENNYDKESVRLFISKIDTFIAFNNILVEPTPAPEDFVDYQIDETQLFEIIKEIYSLTNNFYEDPSKDDVIYKDVKSISAIYKLRKGKRPNYLKGAIALFITTNTSLSRANHSYNVENHANIYCIQECLTDVFLGTVIWSDNPSKFGEFNERKTIANCIAALSPDELLLRKYTKELERLEKDKGLTPNELYFLKSHKIVSEYLVQKTYNDADNFYDKLPEEIYSEIKKRIELDSQQKVEEEKHKHKETKDLLHGAVSDLDVYKKHLETERSKNLRYEIRITKFSGNAAKWITKVVLGLLFPGIIIVFAVTSFPNLIGDKYLLIAARVLALIVSILGIVYGFSVKGFVGRIESSLKTYIRNLILK